MDYSPCYDSGMEKALLKPLVEQGLGVRPIAKLLETSPTNVRYWIQKHGLELKQNPFGRGYISPRAICGFDRYPCSLDLYHQDREMKDPNYRSMRGWAWEKILVELKKCILLCKNCHAAVHAGHLKV